ncbi:hypothetical protein EJ05DRAFT_504959 [Pseudovirgaria hyperparasitica]|uniref:Lysine-specific metallo-endopeptidase domain-containing protein n=1 Tax=Pseudovirgaria hyperparasitica TaxID=470096 RepID=A0A6A6VUL2_9PEZI|nr:uncharacterized protein EJ05DRAFT_504959 [Pseudovirgaria hyperparasitica]KAF2753310.1 hypothetical protein EJ05DRAFT_504959 [Pseudovirgaria hyperparasitica]
MHITSIHRNPLLVVASLVLSTHAADPTYWIHSSCAPYGFSDVMADSLSMATSSVTNKDVYDLQWAFKWIFGSKNTTPSQEIAARYKVTNLVMAEIGNLKSTDNSATASIRIYCDNDARWTLAPDRPDTPEGQKNKDKKPSDQYWVDNENGLRKRGPPSCKDSGMMGVTYHSRTDVRDDYDPSQLRPRDVITICNSILTGSGAEKFRTLKTYIKGYHVAGRKSKQLELIASFTLLHELAHCKPWAKDDIPHPYGWSNVIENRHPQDNAENFAYLGLFAGLLDNKYRLNFNPRDAEDGYIEQLPLKKTKRDVPAKCRDVFYRRNNVECMEVVVV